MVFPARSMSVCIAAAAAGDRSVAAICSRLMPAVKRPVQ
jgi:hypothetical protein